MELDGDPGTRDVVARIRGPARPPVGPRATAARALDDALHFIELAGQGVDRADQIAELVVARQAERLEVAQCDPADLLPELDDRPAEPRGNCQGQQRHHRQKSGPNQQRRIGRLSASLMPDLFRIQDVQERRVVAATLRATAARHGRTARRRYPAAGRDSTVPSRPLLGQPGRDDRLVQTGRQHPTIALGQHEVGTRQAVGLGEHRVGQRKVGFR